jgi:hypothetical protein
MEQKQPTRLLKVQCKKCGYTMRITLKWLNVAVPNCPVNHGVMTYLNAKLIKDVKPLPPFNRVWFEILDQVRQDLINQFKWKWMDGKLKASLIKHGLVAVTGSAVALKLGRPQLTQVGAEYLAKYTSLL